MNGRGRQSIRPPPSPPLSALILVAVFGWAAEGHADQTVYTTATTGTTFTVPEGVETITVKAWGAGGGGAGVGATAIRAGLAAAADSRDQTLPSLLEKA